MRSAACCTTEQLLTALVLARLGQPARVLRGLVHAEPPFTEERGRLDHAMLRGRDLGRRVDLPEERLHRPELTLGHQIALVDQ